MTMLSSLISGNVKQSDPEWLQPIQGQKFCQRSYYLLEKPKAAC
jgi:hypothetical protein